MKSQAAPIVCQIRAIVEYLTLQTCYYSDGELRTIGLAFHYAHADIVAEMDRRRARRVSERYHEVGFADFFSDSDGGDAA